MKISYRKQLFFYFLIIFALFAVAIVAIEQQEERKNKTEELKARLDGFVEIIHAYIEKNQPMDSSITQLNMLADIMPQNIRITVISEDGNVMYDSDVATHDNHLERPEIRSAKFQFSGSNIRMSASANREYMYYAKYYPDYYVRVALPYDVEVQSFLKADNMFIYVVAALFVVVFILLYYAAGRFSKSISRLKKFTTRIKNNQELPRNIDFPNDELGEIGNQLVDIFYQMKKNKQETEKEREKIIQHFQFSETGLCIFSSEHKKIYANTHFLLYLNLISDKPVLDAEAIFKEEAFDTISRFVANDKRTQTNFTHQITKNGKIFRVQAIIFEDKSFEITISDITKVEKTRLMKQEMTNNIAHELRTPVASLRGYLETLSDINLPDEKRKQFIDRAYLQSIRLSNLIEDVSLISKIEETSQQFTMEKVNIRLLVDEVRIDLTDKLQAHDIKMIVNVKDNLSVTGNYTLLYSVFRNLVNNSVDYAGNHVEIHIDNYMEDSDFYYFSYYDTGVGVSEEHLNRLFERFYRVNEGRTRDTGGSGLGLSIVKNAVLLHKGDIKAKNRAEGGLEFLFTLKK